MPFFLSGFLHTDIDSARYMLSALVQGEAAIVALVVTLSLVAVQLAAQSYSARVIEVFRKAPDLWILMGIYGIAIFYGLGVLKLIETANPQLCAEEYICLSNHEGYISFAYYFGIFAFVALVPYMLKMFEMLKPSNVIDMLAERITKEKILTFLKEERDEMSDGKSQFVFLGRGAHVDKDPILPIIEIVRSSLMKYDHGTVRYGLIAIREGVNNLLKNEIFSGDEEIKTSTYIFNHLIKIVELTASREDEYSTLEIIINIQKIGIRATMEELVQATIISIIYLDKIGKIAVEHKFENATYKVIDSLSDIGRTATFKEFEIAIENSVRSLENIGMAVIERRLNGVIWAILALEDLLKIAKNENLVKATQQIEESLKKLKEAISKQKK